MTVESTDPKIKACQMRILSSDGTAAIPAGGSFCSLEKPAMTNEYRSRRSTHCLKSRIRRRREGVDMSTIELSEKKRLRKHHEIIEFIFKFWTKISTHSFDYTLPPMRWCLEWTSVRHVNEETSFESFTIDTWHRVAIAEISGWDSFRA